MDNVKLVLKVQKKRHFLAFGKTYCGYKSPATIGVGARGLGGPQPPNFGKIYQNQPFSGKNPPKVGQKIR